MGVRLTHCMGTRVCGLWCFVVAHTASASPSSCSRWGAAHTAGRLTPSALWGQQQITQLVVHHVHRFWLVRLRVDRLTNLQHPLGSSRFRFRSEWKQQGAGSPLRQLASLSSSAFCGLFYLAPWDRTARRISLLVRTIARPPAATVKPQLPRDPAAWGPSTRSIPVAQPQTQPEQRFPELAWCRLEHERILTVCVVRSMLHHTLDTPTRSVPFQISIPPDWTIMGGVALVWAN